MYPRYWKRWFAMDQRAANHPIQLAMHNSPYRFNVNPAGRRSFKTERAKRRPGLGEIGHDPAVAEPHTVGTAMPLDLDLDVDAIVTGDQLHSGPRKASSRAVRFQLESVCSGSRTSCDSSKARIAAATIAAST